MKILVVSVVLLAAQIVYSIPVVNDQKNVEVVNTPVETPAKVEIVHEGIQTLPAQVGVEHQKVLTLPAKVESIEHKNPFWQWLDDHIDYYLGSLTPLNRIRILDQYYGLGRNRTVDPYHGSVKNRILDPYYGSIKNRILDPYYGSEKNRILDPYYGSDKNRILDPYYGSDRILDPYYGLDRNRILDPYYGSDRNRILDPYYGSERYNRILDPYSRILDPYFNNMRNAYLREWRVPMESSSIIRYFLNGLPAGRLSWHEYRREPTVGRTAGESNVYPKDEAKRSFEDESYLKKGGEGHVGYEKVHGGFDGGHGGFDGGHGGFDGGHGGFDKGSGGFDKIPGGKGDEGKRVHGGYDHGSGGKGEHEKYVPTHW